MLDASNSGGNRKIRFTDGLRYSCPEDLKSSDWMCMKIPVSRLADPDERLQKIVLEVQGSSEKTTLWIRDILFLPRSESI